MAMDIQKCGDKLQVIYDHDRVQGSDIEDESMREPPRSIEEEQAFVNSTMASHFIWINLSPCVRDYLLKEYSIEFVRTLCCGWPKVLLQIKDEADDYENSLDKAAMHMAVKELATLMKRVGYEVD